MSPQFSTRIRNLGVIVLFMSLHAQSQEPETSAPNLATQPKAEAPPRVEAGDYEIDYEEEPGADTDVESGDLPEATPTPAKKGKNKGGSRGAVSTGPIDRNIPSSQGTRSKNKFAPLLKSETKSIYKKNGRPLDVDTD